MHTNTHTYKYVYTHLKHKYLHKYMKIKHIGIQIDIYIRVKKGGLERIKVNKRIINNTFNLTLFSSSQQCSGSRISTFRICIAFFPFLLGLRIPDLISGQRAINLCPVTWKSRRQDNVSLFTSECEFIAASQAGSNISSGQEAIYLRETLIDFGFSRNKATLFHEDNLACAVPGVCRALPDHAPFAARLLRCVGG